MNDVLGALIAEMRAEADKEFALASANVLNNPELAAHLATKSQTRRDCADRLAALLAQQEPDVQVDTLSACEESASSAICAKGTKGCGKSHAEAIRAAHPPAESRLDPDKAAEEWLKKCLLAKGTSEHSLQPIIEQCVRRILGASSHPTNSIVAFITYLFAATTRARAAEPPEPQKETR